MSNHTDPAQSRETTPDATEASETGLAAVSRALLAYRPTSSAGLTDDEWDAWAPLLVRRVLGMGRDTNYSRSTLSATARFVAWALHTAHLATGPDHLARLLRETTITRYAQHLDTVEKRPYASHTAIRAQLRQLAAADPVEPEDVPTDTDTDTDTTRAGAPRSRVLLAVTPTDDDTDGPALVQDDLRIDRTTLGLAPAEQYWTLLRAIRDRILAEHPNVHTTGRDGQHLPIGDVELARLLVATGPMRRTMRHDARLYLCLGLGAGLTARQMSRVRGTDIRTDLRAGEGRMTVAVRDAEGHVVRTVPVLAPFTPMLAGIARHAGDAPALTGRGQNTSRRVESIRVAFSLRDPHNLRPTPWRLRATWILVHLACGTPLPALLAAAGLTTTTAFDALLPYLPATSRDLAHPWAATDVTLPAPVERTPQAE